MKFVCKSSVMASCAALALVAGLHSAAAQDRVRNRSIAYAMTMEEWAMHKTPGAKAECPNGMSDSGPREEFKVLFPEDGTKRTVLDTQLAREALIFFPEPEKETLPFKEAQGPIAPGINLDGKVDADDFTSPDGVKGIDNQFFRAIGCIGSYRDVAALMVGKWRVEHVYNRIVIELTDVDDLTSDDDVTVTTYRGTSNLLPDASGVKYIPGTTQVLDLRYGKDFIQTFKAKIVDGVLISQAADYLMPYQSSRYNLSDIFFHDLKFELKLTETSAEGFMGGYMDIDTWHYQRQANISTHHQSYGQESAQGLYKVLTRLADGYPDPKTGRNTAISAALKVRFTQVFIERPPAATASAGQRDPNAR